MKKILLLICILILFKFNSFSQTIPVGDYSENIARFNQLLGISGDLSSFTQHPLNSPFSSPGDSALQNMVGSKNLIPKFKPFGIPVSIKVLPFTWLNDYNTKLPFGYNNGPLYPNVGYQTMVTGGVYIKAGIINIQFKPEIVQAQNAPFFTFADVQANYLTTLIAPFYKTINGIDAPERFGPYGINYAGLGQSKLTASFKNLELGISTENMWWGPGVQNSIMMSNSAPGFLHWTFNTVNPIKTPIGSFEWQVIGGRLVQSGYTPYDPNKLVYGNNSEYVAKPVVTRYLSAFTFNYHPKWTEGLFIGISGYDYMNIDSAYQARGFFKKYFPVFVNSATANNYNSGTSITNGAGQDFAYAINVRQVFKNAHAEVYFEFARNDASSNFTDMLIEPENASGFTLGSAKIFQLHKNRFLQLRFELTNLQISDDFLNRNEPTWYVHPYGGPRDGYTNSGRYVGAGIGPGSNSLMFDISYIRKQSSFGVKVERYLHNNDLYYEAFSYSTNFVSNWVQTSSTFYANIKLSKFLISAQYSPIHVYNYEYLQNNDLMNKNFRLTFTYYFD